jgi:hypothetical protein
MKMHTSRSMTSTINTSRRESLFRPRCYKISDTLMAGDDTLAVDGCTLTVGGDTSTIDGYTLAVGGGTLTVDGDTLMSADGTWTVDNDTFAIGSCTLTCADGI